MTPTNKFVPAEVNKRAASAFYANATMPEIIVVEDWKSVYNSSSHWRDLRSRLSKLSQTRVLELLASLNNAVESPQRPFDSGLQATVVCRLGDDSRRIKALKRRMIDSPPRILVYEEQLAILAKYALLYSHAKIWPTDGNQLLLEAMLSFNFLRSNEISSGATDPITRCLFQEIRETATDNEHGLLAMKRFGAFTEWARTDAARVSRNYLDVDATIKESTGLTYLEFAAATIAFHSYYVSLNQSKLSAFLDVDAYLNGIKHPEVLKHWLDQSSVDIEEAKTLLERSADSTSLASLRAFMARPLIRYQRVVYCPAARYLPNIAGTGFLFKITNYLKEKKGSRDSDQFLGFYGEFIEFYVCKRIEEASTAGASLFREKVFGPTNSRSSDLALFNKTEAVFVDVNSKRLHVEKSVLGLQIDSITEDLEKMITSKVKKLSQRALDFKRGKLTYPGIDPAKIDRIYGLVVSPQGLTRLAGVPDVLEKLLPNVPDGLCAWDYFDLAEVELLADSQPSQIDLAELLAKKGADDFGRRRSLMNFIFFKMRDRFHVRKTNDDILADRWFQDIIATAKAWGLPSP